MDLGYDTFSIRRRDSFFVFLKNHFENSFGVTTYFIFLKESKIIKKTLNVTTNMEKRV